MDRDLNLVLIFRSATEYPIGNKEGESRREVPVFPFIYFCGTTAIFVEDIAWDSQKSRQSEKLLITWQNFWKSNHL